MIRVLIIGSCVTRDAFELPEAEPLTLAGYFARTSIASAFGELAFVDVGLGAITSAFQRRLVGHDHSKSLPGTIQQDDYDLIVYDPIDERFDLLRAGDGSLATYSSELAGVLRDTSGWERVRSGSGEFFDLWERGWKRFVEILDRGGRRGLLRVNQVYWSERTTCGDDFSPTYPPHSVRRANAFLGRLYERMEQDLRPEQFITYDPEQLVAADEHKWGRSPFHYTNDYYRALLRPLVEPVTDFDDRVPDGTRARLDDVAQQLHEAIVERDAATWRIVAVHEGAWAEEVGTRPAEIDTRSNGALELTDTARVSFTGGDGSYEVRVGLTRPLVGADGLTVRLKLDGWSAIRYVAVGHTAQGFRHVKIPNPPVGEWFTFSFGYGDVIDRLQNKEVQTGAATVRDVRVYVRGDAGSGAEVHLDWVAAWSSGRASARPGARLPGLTPSSQQAFAAVVSYLHQRNPLLEQQVARFQDTGDFPVSGEKYLPWPPGDRRPPALDEVGTYGHVWHSQHLAGALLTLHATDGSSSGVAAARENVTAWLDDNYFAPGDGSRYIWYDHAVAERTLVFLLMHEVALAQGHDARFVGRLESAIVAHAQLLESEAFYAAQQPSRFHNHAWFQDVALLAVGVFLEGHPAARRWRQRPLDRLKRQFEELVAIDDEYAVFVENSTGYHVGIQSLASFADSLARTCDAESVTAAVAAGMWRWAALVKYPDGRLPAHGDTFRLANPVKRSLVKHTSDPRFAVLPNAGYAVARGSQGDVPWVLRMIASSRSATHKHEDNLSLTLYADGIEWLIDPSFHSHEYGKTVPDRLRRAVSHTAPWVDSVPYSTEPGRATITGSRHDEGTFVVEGRHWSFQAHVVQRRIDGSLNLLDMRVQDSVERNDDVGERALIYSTFHVGDGVNVDVEDCGALLTHPASALRIRLTFDGAEAVQVVTAWDEDAGSGSVSGTGFMETVDTTSVIAKWRAYSFSWDLRAVE